MRKGSLLALSGLVLCLCYSIACRDKAAIVELEEYRAQTAIEQQNKALVGRVMAAIGAADLAVVEELVSPNFIEYTPSTTIAMRSLAEFVEHIKMIHRGVSDFTIHLVEPCADGDMVTSRYVMSGIHQGEFLGIPPTGNKFKAEVEFSSSGSRMERSWRCGKSLTVWAYLSSSAWSSGRKSSRNKNQRGL